MFFLVKVFRYHFHAEPKVQATELLLQERTPRDVPIARMFTPTIIHGRSRTLWSLSFLRRFLTRRTTPCPIRICFPNGRYSVMVSAAGSGYSRYWNGLSHYALARGHDSRSVEGRISYLRDAKTSDVWSAGYQPSGVAPDRYEVDFSEDRAEIVRRDADRSSTTLEVVVSPEDDAEIRRVTIKNTGFSTRDIEVTSYAEIVLATPAADQAHPALL